MGIGITSNAGADGADVRHTNVSIPNGDRHYLELGETAQLGWNAARFNPQWG